MSSNSELATKFADFPNGDDGIDKAIKAIRQEGGAVDNYCWIYVDDKLKREGAYSKRFWDAVEFLVAEWDYGLRIKNLRWWSKYRIMLALRKLFGKNKTKFVCGD